MSTDNEASGVKSAQGVYGKVIGIINDRHQLDAFLQSLSVLGVSDVEILDGLAGIQRIEALQETVSGYFFGDMEGEMLQRYLEAAKSDLIVFAAEVNPESADKAAEIAQKHGASEVVHFGNSVVTSY